MQGQGVNVLCSKACPANGTSNGQFSHTNPTLSAAAELQPAIVELLSSSLHKSSLPTYIRSWHLFQQFSHNIFGHASFSFPISPMTLSLFIAYLYDKGYVPSTVNTYVSSLAYFHKLSNFSYASKCFFLMQMRKGYRKKRQHVDTRLPITLPILHKLVDSAESFSCPNYTKVQFCAMCSLAFYAFLRVGTH